MDPGKALWLRWWDVWLLFFIVYTAFTCPYEVAFNAYDYDHWCALWRQSCPVVCCLLRAAQTNCNRSRNRRLYYDSKHASSRMPVALHLGRFGPDTLFVAGE